MEVDDEAGCSDGHVEDDLEPSRRGHNCTHDDQRIVGVLEHWRGLAANQGMSQHHTLLDQPLQHIHLPLGDAVEKDDRTGRVEDHVHQAENAAGAKDSVHTPPMDRVEGLGEV